jgi:protocatechuate 3,4-dioxygenase beta subunit
MRSLRLVLLIGTVVGHVLQAQPSGAIHGTVLDQNGRPVENAQLVLAPGSRRTISVDDGRFNIPDVNAGVYLLSVRRIGYAPTTVSVTLGDSTVTLAVTLVAIPTQLDAIHIREKSSGIRYSAVVLDQYNQPVADAEVMAIGINDNLKTDARGRFTVPKLARGTLMLRIRKIGYAAYFDSFRVLAERADTVQMTRLAQSLTPVEIKERSGFGSDYWAYRDLDQRIRWKGSMAGAISREELAQQGTVNLCDALPRTASGNRYVFIPPDACYKRFFRVLLDGVQCEQRKLTDFTADRVKAIEYFPLAGLDTLRALPSDHSGNLKRRGCPPEVFVIWTRHDIQSAPSRVQALMARPADQPLPAATGEVVRSSLSPTPSRLAGDMIDTTGHPARPTFGETDTVPASTIPSRLQGQVVDSAGHPVRAAVVETDDPPRAVISDGDGYFRFSELPPGPTTIRVWRDGFMGTEFQLRLPPDTTVNIGVKLVEAAQPAESEHVDLTPESDGGAPVRKVRVISTEGRPVVHASVNIEGGETRVTDSRGEMSIGGGKRNVFTLSVRRIGYTPWFGKVDFADTTAVMTVTLARIAQTLAPVTVTGEASTNSPLARTGFYDRWIMRQKGALSAVFIGPEEIEFRHPNKISNMLSGLNGVCMRHLNTKNSKGEALTSPNLYAFSSTGNCNCPMAIIIDGMQQYPAPAIDDVLDANDVAAIEVYDRGGNMPISLQANDNTCGVIALWTGNRR